MQRVASTVEEDMIIKAIQEEATWEKLPKRLKIFLSSNEEWQRRYQCISINVVSQLLLIFNCSKGDIEADTSFFKRWNTCFS